MGTALVAPAVRVGVALAFGARCVLDLGLGFAFGLGVDLATYDWEVPVLRFFGGSRYVSSCLEW